MCPLCLGTDISHPDLSNQKEFNGCSFHQYQEGSMWRVSPWWHSSSGYVIAATHKHASFHIPPVFDLKNSEILNLFSRHGTLMARLIAGICPSAIIHVIKLHTVHWIHPSSFTAMGFTDRGLNLLHSLRHVAPRSFKSTRTALSGLLDMLPSLKQI